MAWTNGKVPNKFETTLGNEVTQIQCVAMTYWTSEVHEAIIVSVAALSDYLLKSNGQIAKVVDLVRGKLNAQNRITLGESTPIPFRVEVVCSRFFQVLWWCWTFTQETSLVD